MPPFPFWFQRNRHFPLFASAPETIRYRGEDDPKTIVKHMRLGCLNGVLDELCQNGRFHEKWTATLRLIALEERDSFQPIGSAEMLAHVVVPHPVEAFLFLSRHTNLCGHSLVLFPQIVSEFFRIVVFKAEASDSMLFTTSTDLVQWRDDVCLVVQDTKTKDESNGV